MIWKWRGKQYRIKKVQATRQWSNQLIIKKKDYKKTAISEYANSNSPQRDAK